MEVMGIKEYAAILIRLVKACSEYALKSEALKRQAIKSLDNLVEYCRASMGGLLDEQFRVIFLNSQNEVIAEEIVQEGTVNQTVVYPRKVLELALKHKATGLILVHNHPSGHLKPSAADQERLAREFERRFSLEDHVEVESASFENGLLQINLVRRIPEAMKPRRVQIDAGAKGHLRRRLDTLACLSRALSRGKARAPSV